MGDEQTPEEVLNTIGDEQARAVLAAIAREPSSVKELTEKLDLSQATIYRRVAQLQKHDLLNERTLVADDGNHYEEYTCNFNSTVVSLEDADYNVRVFRDENLPDRFSRLWDDLANTD